MKLLIIEDEMGIVNFLKQGLEEEGFFVDFSLSGIDGLKKAKSGGYNLLLLDWMVPELTGLEICKEFRKLDKKTPIIFLTARDTVQETIVGLQSGANDYIKKPFHFDELLARIRVQTREGKKELTTLTIREVEIDRQRHEVRNNGKQVALTQKEFDLLTFLVQHKNKVCERKEIIEKVWDIHFDYNTGVIDVYINALRKKLDLNESNDFIQTVRGVGYMAHEERESETKLTTIIT